MVNIILQNASIFLNTLLLITSVYTITYSAKMFINYKSGVKLVYNITNSMKNMANDYKVELYKNDDFFKLSESKISSFPLGNTFEIDNYYPNF